MVTTDTITLIIAVYGAVLGTLSLLASIFLGVAEFKRNRPNMRVTATTASLTNALGKWSESLVCLTASNIGQRSITLTSVGFLLPTKDKMQMLTPYHPETPTKTGLPAEIVEGKSFAVFYPCRIFREIQDINKINAVYFGDQTGKMWTRKVSRHDRDTWLGIESKGWRLEWNPEMRVWIPEPPMELIR